MARGFKCVRAQVAIPGLEGTYGTSLKKTSEETAGRVDQQADLPSTEGFEPGPYLRTIPKLFERLRLKLGDQVELLHDIHQKLAPIDAARLAQEVAYLASRSDISEELTRFQSHLIQARELLKESSEVGKKLDFLLQELNREANTLLSKTSDVPEVGAEVSRQAIEMKSEIEKLREQVQNIE